MSTRARVVATALFALLLAGCWHTDVVRVAPGHVDVRATPENIAVEGVDPPEDPGEHMLVFSPGVFAGGGAAFNTPDGTRGAYTVGAEASVHYGTRKYSHAEDDFIIYPQRAVGLNAGYLLVSQERAGPSVGYLEAQYYADGLGIAGGWAWDPSRAHHGPQVTAFLGPIYARFTKFLSERAELTFGLFFKLPHAWVWAR